MKKLFHSHLLNYEMIIANSYPMRGRGIIVNFKRHFSLDVTIK